MSANLSQNYLYQVLLLLLIEAILCWLWMRKGNKLVVAPLPPGPRGLPIVGYLPFLGKNLHHEFSKLAEEYGPIYKLWLGSKLCIVVSSPSLAKQVCRDLDVVFSNRDPTIAALTLTHNAMDITWSSSGPYWRNIRKLFFREGMQISDSKDLKVVEVDVHFRSDKHFERDWLRKDLNVIGFGLIGWLAPSSFLAINGLFPALGLSN
ncbi:flavonoid 3'-monooxygenase CYP75B137-like [Impatiens glandulifera]|uniref:flavonoid 3'-monooxygenase CYP75B137-like n=1 Tax=Impatiens glandulifera TaxID=253017 RepID=UPI001FB0E950|nr:flavonoid 3'-monooxygenase CYP75B137-like [Impatiens glandulifera]